MGVSYTPRGQHRNSGWGRRSWGWASVCHAGNRTHCSAAAAKHGRQATYRITHASSIDPRIFSAAIATASLVGSPMGGVRRQSSQRRSDRARTGATSWSSTSTQLGRTAYGSMSRSGTRCCRNLAPTSGPKPAFRISSGQLRSISSTSPTASACRTFRVKTDASMLRSIPALSGRTSIYSAHRKDLGLSSEVPSITTGSAEPCNLVPTNSSPSRKPSVIFGISAGWATGLLELLLSLNWNLVIVSFGGGRKRPSLRSGFREAASLKQNTIEAGPRRPRG